MKYNLIIITIALTLASFKVANKPELTVENVVNYQLYGNDLKGDVSEVIERNYTIRDSARSLTFEARSQYNKAGQVTQYTSYRIVQYRDSSVLQKASRINYFYENEKLTTYESFSFSETEEVPDASKRSYIKYRYNNSKKASYKAYRYGEFSHAGKITVLDNQHATESIKYRKSKLQPISYEIECDENLQKTRSIKNEIYQGKEKSDTTVFIYEKGNLIEKINEHLIQKYSYEFDPKGNWIKRLTKLSTDKIVSEIEREIVYR